MVVTRKYVCAESEVPEQLGLSLPTHDRASWRRLARVRHLGCNNSLMLTLAAMCALVTKNCSCAASGPSAVDPVKRLTLSSRGLRTYKACAETDSLGKLRKPRD